MAPILFPVIRVSEEELAELADNPKFVLPIYSLVLIPIALYVYHDIVDKRWRQIHVIFRYVVFYISLYVVTAIALVAYVVIQWRYGMDYKEVGAGTLTFVVGIHRLWTLIRLIRILQGHAGLVQVLQICDRKMSELSVEMGHIREINYYLLERPPEGARRRHLAISASLFDDDYPGDSARISWLTKPVRVHSDDINECIARIAIWMRAVIRSTDVRIWDVLTRSRFSGSQTLHKNLYNTLLDVVLEKVTPITPMQLCKNPAEELLNHPNEGQLRNIGIGVVWAAARMRAEEIAQVVSEMPASWMNDTLLSGKELMLETGVCLMLAGMQVPNVLMDMLRANDKEDGDYDGFWRIVDKLFAEAVVGSLCVDWGDDSDDDDEEDDKHTVITDEEYEKLVDNVKRGLLHLRAALKLKDIEKRFLRHRLQHLITGAYYGGYVVEGMLGEHAEHIYLPGNVVEYPLYQAELVFVLRELLQDVGWCDGDSDFQDQAGSRRGPWVMCSEHDRGACPGGTFRSFMMEAADAARSVVDILKTAYVPRMIVIKDEETRRLWFG